MMKKYSNVILLFLAIMVVVGSLFWAGSAEFSGTDDKATQIIEATNYKPWFDYIVEPSSSVVESFLFSVQAALGSAILFYGIGYFVGKKSKLDELSKTKL